VAYSTKWAISPIRHGLRRGTGGPEVLIHPKGRRDGGGLVGAAPNRIRQEVRPFGIVREAHQDRIHGAAGVARHQSDPYLPRKAQRGLNRQKGIPRVHVGDRGLAAHHLRSEDLHRPVAALDAKEARQGRAAANRKVQDARSQVQIGIQEIQVGIKARIEAGQARSGPFPGNDFDVELLLAGQGPGARYLVVRNVEGLPKPIGACFGARGQRGPVVLQTRDTGFVGTMTSKWVLSPLIRVAYTARLPVQPIGGTSDMPNSG
jgi:hypothetical protein